MKKEERTELICGLSGLCVFRKLREQEPVRRLLELLSSEGGPGERMNSFGAFVWSLARDGYCFSDFLRRAVFEDENPYMTGMARGKGLPEALKENAAAELRLFSKLSELSPAELWERDEEPGFSGHIPCFENHPVDFQEAYEKRLSEICRYGYGIFSSAGMFRVEGEEILDYIREVWQTMKVAIQRGLNNEGVLPGGLKLQRKAAQYYAKARDFNGTIGGNALPLAYALAVSEENAGGGEIVTAPTCGSCGVLPSVLYYLMTQNELAETRVYRALLTAGMIGNIVKTNGSISGAEVGCQGEVGVACAMAGGAAAQLLGGSIYQIEYAAEMGLEHHLGLTCDPMKGLVQIPCIERNALASMRALDHALYALMSDGRHKVSFDAAVEVMMETGQALPSLYRETSMGGLALIH